MSRLSKLLRPLTLTLLIGAPALLPQAALAQSAAPQPAKAPAAAATSTAALVYTVKTGDTLYRIATERGLKVEDLMRLNALSSTDVEIGQELKLPSGTPAPTAAPAPTPPVSQVGAEQGKPAARPEPAKPEPTKPASAAQTPEKPADEAPVKSGILTVVKMGNVIAGVSVKAPARLRMGDAFVLRLSGTRAGEARVTFPSEVGEDVRRPAEALTPIGAAGEYLALGRVVLGKTTPLTYSVVIGQEVLRRSVPVASLDQPIQHLTLAKSLTDRLKAPNRPAEEKVVEAAYALRTPQAWSKPFAPPLMSKSVSSSFGQPRTYLAGGPVAYHYGMDFPAPVGTAVHAVNDGHVVIAATFPVRGGLIVIDHGAGLVSLYFHQSKLLVRAGQTVRRGQIIGQVGSTGLSAGPHLHLEMRVRGEATLPTEYFDRLWP